MLNETESSRKQVLEASLQGTKEFLSSYKILEYVYEADLQATLYCSIKKKLEKCKWNFDNKEWNIGRSKNENTKTNTPCLVHCEQRYKKERIDIAIWDPNQENANKDYFDKDLLLLIEIKYFFTAENAIKGVKKDRDKLKNLKLKEYQNGLAITFTVDENKKLLKEGNIIDISEMLNEKRLKGNPIQVFIACKDGIIKILD